MNVKILKTQALLQEVLQEAFYMLDDARLNTLHIIKVECSKGKESAKVYLDPTPFDKDEQKEILKLFKKANPIIRQYLQTSLSWYKIPLLYYDFDESLENINRLESLFKQIKKQNNQK